MSGLTHNQLRSIFAVAALFGVLAISTQAFAQYKSGGHVKRSHGSHSSHGAGGYSHRSSGGLVGYVKSNRSYNAQYHSSGSIIRNHGLRLNTYGYRDVLRSGVRLGNAGYNNGNRLSSALKRNVQIRNGNRDQGANDRRVQRVQQKLGIKNHGFGVIADPNYIGNVRRTNQFNSDSDLYYVDQAGVSVLSSNNKVSDGYYDDDFRQVVVVEGSGGSPACPKGHDCGYRLYEDGTGPRIISLGASLEGLPPQDGLNGGPKVITLD